MTTTARFVEIGELVARLAGRAPELARDLLPAGVQRGSEWCVARTDSPLGCSISVHIAGNKRAYEGVDLARPYHAIQGAMADPGGCLSAFRGRCYTLFEG